MTTGKYIRFGSPVTGLFAQSGAPAIANHIVDLASEGIGFVFQPQNADPITHVLVQYGLRLGAPPTYIAGIEGVNTANAFPDGVYRTNGGNCSATFRPPADTSWDGTSQWIELGNPYIPTQGETICYTVRYDSATGDTINSSNYSSFGSTWTNLPAFNSFPYALRNTAGSWTTQPNFGVGGVRTANDRYGSIVPSFYTTRSPSTIGNAVAAKLVIPASFGDTFRVAGIRAAVSIAGATGRAPILKLWDGTTTLASSTLDSDRLGASVTSVYRVQEYYFGSSVLLNCGSPYYLGFETADAVNGGIILYGIRFDTAADNDSDGGSGFCCLATFDGTTWTDDTTVRPMVEFILEDFTEPSGSGSIVVPMSPFRQRVIG